MSTSMIATGRFTKHMARTRMPRTTLIVTCLTLAAVVTAAGTAAAEDPTPTATEVDVVGTVPPPTPEETDLVEDVPSSEAPAPTTTSEPDPAWSDETYVPTSKPSDTTHGQACVPGYRYTATTKDKDYHKGVGAEQANYNGTSRTARSTFTSEATGKVGIAHSGELNVGGSIAVVEIEGKFNVNVSVELTAKLGNTISVDTPSKKTTFARYDVFRLKSYGYSQYLYTNCTKGVKNNVTIYTPRRADWALWES